MFPTAGKVLSSTARFGSARRARSKAEQVGHLHEELPAVVDEPAAGAEKIRVERRERGVKILEVAVIADVDGGSGVEEVGNQEVGVQILFPGQCAELAIGEGRVVLEDEADGELAVDLVISLGTDNVIVEDGGIRVAQP